MPLQAAERHQAYQRSVVQAVTAATRTAWASVTVGNLDAAWASVSGTVLAATIAGQIAAARDADPYLAAVLAEQGARDAPEGAVQAAGFAGVASDGRPLASLLGEPLIGVKTALLTLNQGIQPDIVPPAVPARAGVMTPAQALASGGSRLEMLVQTTVQDAGRAAVSAGMLARPHVAGYVRALSLPSCSRCAILAGRWYRVSSGFQRHPRQPLRLPHDPLRTSGRT